MRNSSGLNDSKDKFTVPTCFSCFCPVRRLKSVRGSLSYKLGMCVAYSTDTHSYVKIAQGFFPWLLQTFFEVTFSSAVCYPGTEEKGLGQDIRNVLPTCKTDEQVSGRKSNGPGVSRYREVIWHFCASTFLFWKVGIITVPITGLLWRLKDTTCVKCLEQCLAQ